MNILVTKECQSMTAFVCFGLFEIQRMLFGLRNVATAYCRLVQADDVILHTGDPDDHIDLLDRTLEAHFHSGIKLKGKKTILSRTPRTTSDSR